MNQIKSKIILGICMSHDAGVAIIKDGKILSAINEERYSRVKATTGYPEQSLKVIWKISGIKPEEIDVVAIAGYSLSGNPPTNNDFSYNNGNFSLAQRIAEFIDRIPFIRNIQSTLIFSDLHRSISHYLGRKKIKIIEEKLSAIGCRADIKIYEHHDSHLASAYYTSGMDECLVISNDGFGDNLCSKVAIGRNGRMEIIKRNSYFNSIGVYYNYVTNLCGFKKEHHAGKTTGLAAYGNSDLTISYFRDRLVWDAKSGKYFNHGFLFRNALREIQLRFKGVQREHVAAGIQRHAEELLVEMVRHYISLTGIRKVALAGGVHANVRVNQKIAEIQGIERVSIFQHMGDGGLAVGSAYLAAAEFSKERVTPYQLDSVYLGSSFTDEECHLALSATSLSFKKVKNMAKEVAIHLQNNKIVARCAGPMEYGPRSLGNRSILYPAIKPEINQWLNKQLNRTEFMPFAPVIRDIDASDFFLNVTEVNKYSAEFMTLAFNATKRCREEAPATVHVDGSARPQIIRREVNPEYYDILTAYKEITGLSILVNTSFNMHEEPIVCTPDEAIKAFKKSNLDILILGSYLVENSKT